MSVVPLSSGAGTNLAGRLVEEIGRAVVAGRYVPGDLLPKEEELEAAHGVSRTVVREAIKVLTAKGLVEVRKRIGTRVRETESWSVFDTQVLRWFVQEGRAAQVMRDLVELRQVVEPAAARLAAGRASMADLGRIDEARRRMASGATDHDAYADADADFHMAVYVASHNLMFARFGSLVVDFLRVSFDAQQRAREAEGGEVDFHEDARAHALVYDAIDRQDGTSAAEAMLRVVLDGKRALGVALERLDPAGPSDG